MNPGGYANGIRGSTPSKPDKAEILILGGIGDDISVYLRVSNYRQIRIEPEMLNRVEGEVIEP